MRARWIAAALLILTCAAYRDSFRAGFVHWDDDRYVTENPHVTAGLTPDAIGWAFAGAREGNWHPLTWLSHMADVTLFGLDARGHHAVSVLLHAVNASLLFLLLFRMTGATGPSAFAAALFAVHPLHVESVAWIAERKDVLGALLWILTTAAWLRWIETRTTARYVLVIALYVLGLMAKPMLVTLPFTLLLLDFWPLGRLERSPRVPLLREKAPLLFLSAASCVVTLAVQHAAGTVQRFESLPAGERLANALVAYVAYLGQTVRPASLAFFYPHPHLRLLSGSALAAAAVLVATTIAVTRLRDRAPYLLFGWLWYVGTLVPVIGLVQVGGQARADRYTYVPLIGIFVAVSWAAARLGGLRPWAARAVAIAELAVLGALCVVTARQVRVWHDDASLFGHALAVTGDNSLAYSNLGLALFDAGRVEEAIGAYRRALAIEPGYGAALGNLALALATRGDDTGAVATYGEALAQSPGDPVLHFQLARALARLDRGAEAEAHYREAIRLRPAYPEAHDNLGTLIAARGDTLAAIAQYEQAIRLAPGDATARYNLGNALLSVGRIPDARASLEEAIRLRPDFAEAHNSLGVTYLHEGNPCQAVVAFTRALALRPDAPGVRDNVVEAQRMCAKPMVPLR